MNANDLYRYVVSKSTIYKYSILDPVNNNSLMKIPSRKEKQSNISSIISLGNDQILISHGVVIKLVDLKYRVLLSERPVDKPINLVAYSKKLSVVIGYTTPQEPSETTGTGSEKIMALPVDIGKGSLLESIGKGITKGDNSFRSSFSPIPLTFGEASSAQVIKEETTLIGNSKNSSSLVLKILQHLKDNGNVADFEKWALAYFKYPNRWIKASKTGNVEETIKATTVPEVDSKRPYYRSKTDRQVDFTFIYDICSILFHHVGRVGTTSLSSLKNGPKPTKLVKLHKGFSPDRLLNYLIGHPLLPSQQLPGLLLTLNRYPDIVRNAIKRAPTLRCDTVVSALRSKDEDTFTSAIIRLEHRFDSRQITNSIKRVYLTKPSSVSSSSSSSSTISTSGDGDGLLDVSFPDNGVTLESIIRRMVELDIGWDLIPYFIDAGGLFGWDELFLEELDSTISDRVGLYKGGYEVLAMLEESVRDLNLNIKRKQHAANVDGNIASNDEVTQASFEADSSNTVVPVLVSAEEQSQQRMKSVLQIGFADKYVYGKKTETNSSQSTSAIAPYTVERLLF